MLFLFLEQGIYVLQDNKFRLLTQMSAGKQYLEHASKVFNRIEDWGSLLRNVEPLGKLQCQSQQTFEFKIGFKVVHFCINTFL